MEKPRYDAFLSHATPDKPAVEELARLLKKRGFEPWLDKWNLIPGEPWQEAIEKALENCAACAVCLGPSGTGPWQNEEMRAAIDSRVSGERGPFRVIPVLLPGAERGEPSRLPAFLRATTWVEFRETLDDEKALHRLDCGIRGIPPGSDPGEAVAEGACPYRGLQVFDIGDALFFFGREALTGWLLDKLRTDRTGNRFLAIVGPSGSGKSSLARAGLVANLKRGEIPGSDAWPVAICKPGAQPLESLAVALAGAARLGDSPSAVRELIRDLGTDPRMLHLTTRVSLRDAPADRRLVIFVDQFEEIFTLCPDEAQRKSIIANLLHAATAADGQTIVVVTLRADFYGRCAAYPDLAAAVSDRQSLVGPMTRDELRSAVERPAYLTGCELEGGLADLLLNEVAAQPGSLPLLEHALLQIWQRREGGRRLTVAAYHEIGGVAGALEKHAEEVYSDFAEEEKETCRRVFLRLVQVDEQEKATKRRQGLDDLAPASEVDGRVMATVISRLTNARLLTTDQEKRPTIELAHEALFSNWDRLKQWIEQDREALQIRRRLDQSAADWIGAGRDRGILYRGDRLARAKDWADSHPGELSADTWEFLTTSVSARDEERIRELAQARRQKALTLAFATMAAITTIVAIFAIGMSRVARTQKKMALASELTVRSQSALPSDDPQLELLLAVQSLNMAQEFKKPYWSRAQSALRQTLSQSGGIPIPVGLATSSFLTLDRRWLATVGKDLHLRLWDLTAEAPWSFSRDLGTLPTTNSASPTVSIYAKNSWLMIAGLQRSWLLDLKNPSAKLSTSTPLKGEDWPFEGDPFSPDGHWLVTRQGADLLLRNMDNIKKRPQLLSEWTGGPLCFSQDSLTLAEGSRKAVQIWNLTSPSSLPRLVNLPLPESNLPKDAEPLKKLRRLSDPERDTYGTESLIRTLTFDTDKGVFIATAKLPLSQSIGFWTIRADGNLKGPSLLDGCTNERAITHSKAALFFCHAEGKSGLWMTRPTKGNSVSSSATWKFDASRADLSPDEIWVAAEDSRGNIYLGKKSDQGFKEPVLMKQATPVTMVGFSATSRWLITQGGSEAPRLWDLGRGVDIPYFEPRILPINPESILRVDASGNLLRRDQRSKRLRLWKLTGEPKTQEFPGSEASTSPLALSSDGRSFVAGRKDGTLLLWRIHFDGRVLQPTVLPVRLRLGTLALSPSGRWLAAVDLDGKASLWNLQGTMMATYLLPDVESTQALSFSARDDLLAAIEPAQSHATIYKIVLGEEGISLRDKKSFSISLNSPQAIAFSPSDNWLAIGGEDRSIQILTPSGEEVLLESHVSSVRSLSFSSDGRWLAAGGRDGTIQLWRWDGKETETKPIILAGHSGTISSLAFTPQGLVSSAGDGTVRLWELSTQGLIQRGCQSAGRNLTLKEWKTYIPSEPYQESEPCPGLPRAPD